MAIKDEILQALNARNQVEASTSTVFVRGDPEIMENSN
jgi:hypothetical protein